LDFPHEPGGWEGGEGGAAGKVERGREGWKREKVI
jgi:hypothetical protein